MHETSSAISPIALIYLGMGLVMARILLDGTHPRHFTLFQWVQFLLDGIRITLLWPLILFLEKFEHWLKASAPANEDHAPTASATVDDSQDAAGE